MKITRTRLRQIVNEEITRSLNEAEPEGAAEQTPPGTSDPEGTQASDEPATTTSISTPTRPWIALTAFPKPHAIGISIIAPKSSEVAPACIFIGMANGTAKIGIENIHIVSGGPSAMKAKAIQIAKQMQAKSKIPVGIFSSGFAELRNMTSDEARGVVIDTDAMKPETEGGTGKVIAPIPEKK